VTPPPAERTVIGKVRLILEALADAGRLGQSELSRRTGIPKASVYRLCRDLIEWGAVERAGDAFRLGPRLFELGSLVPSRRNLREAAFHYLEDLAGATGETVHLAVLDSLEVMYVERLPGRSASVVPSTVAARLPLHCTATGRCLLAFGPPELLVGVLEAGLEPLTSASIADADGLSELLEQVRSAGVAIEREEVAAGLMSIGAPVFELGGRLAGAISVTGPVAEAGVPGISTAVRVAAAGISRRLGAG
jgi:DNA-binding IclR family transcriptional regulator